MKFNILIKALLTFPDLSSIRPFSQLRKKIYETIIIQR